MKCLIVYPGLRPVVVDEEITLDFLQEAVGGNIEYINIFENDPYISVIVNEEGKLEGMRPNKFVFCKHGKLSEILAGPIVILRTNDEGDDISLTYEDIEKYTEVFKKDYIITE